MFWSYCRPYCRSMWFAASVAFMLLAPAALVPARGETAQQAAVVDSAKSDRPATDKSGQDATAQAGQLNPTPGAKEEAPPAKEAPSADQVQPAAPSKSLTERAID